MKNVSAREGDEVVELYLAGAGAAGDPIRQLRGFRRVHLRPGEAREVEFELGASDVPTSPVKISIGGGQPVGSVARVEGTL